MSRHRSHVAAPPAHPHHTVSLHAPGAKSVAVTGDFCGWCPEGQPLTHDGNGTWKGTINLQPGRYEYRFVVDGEWRDDPDCGERVDNPFGTKNCVFTV
jgi:1,4-alpha-glucan branching enzyme